METIQTEAVRNKGRQNSQPLKWTQYSLLLILENLIPKRSSGILKIMITRIYVNVAILGLVLSFILDRAYVGCQK